MKSLVLILVFLSMILFNPISAQFWKKQNVDFPAPTQGWQIKIVNDNVTWMWGRGGAYGTDGWEQSYLDYNFCVTKNGGENWICGDFPFNGAPGDLTSMSAIDDSTAWITCVVSTDGFFDAYLSKVYKTNNSGKDWIEVNINIGSNWVDNIHFFDKLNGVIIADPADNEFNIFTTADGGLNWEKVKNEHIADAIDDSEYGVQSVMTTQNDKMWFNTYYNRVYYSSDKGNNWKAWEAPESSTGLGLQMDSDEDNNVYLMDIDFDNFKYLLFRKNINESDWTDLTPNDNDKFLYFASVPGSSSLIMHNTADNKTRISRDKGANWIVIDSIDNVNKNFIFFKSSTVGFTFPDVEDGGINHVLKYSGSPLSGLLSQKPINVDISVFPNPAMDQIFVKSEHLKMDNYWLLINDAFGNLIYKKVLMRASDISEFITTSNFPSGVYTLSLSNMDGVKSVPFIKM